MGVKFGVFMCDEVVNTWLSPALPLQPRVPRAKVSEGHVKVTRSITPRNRETRTLYSGATSLKSHPGCSSAFLE